MLVSYPFQSYIIITKGVFATTAIPCFVVKRENTKDNTKIFIGFSFSAPFQPSYLFPDKRDKTLYFRAIDKRLLLINFFSTLETFPTLHGL